MHYKKIYKKIHTIENEYKALKKDLDKQSLLKSSKNYYLKEDKEEFKKIWKRYIDFFEVLKNLLRASAYRRFFFVINYNKLVLRKYLVHFYFRVLFDLLESFWKHEEFIRLFLDENFRRDYWLFAKYIYLPKYINIFNTPKIFIEPFKSYVDINVYKLLYKLKNLDWKNTLNTDYSNLFFWIKHRIDKLVFFIAKHIGNLIAHTKFSTRKIWLITKQNIIKYLENANPWDIFLSRWNWNASNLSIPGFWKHMSMYIGTWKYLKNNFKWDFLDDLIDKNHYIIEANDKWISILNIYDFIIHNDYLWVFRTNFKKEKIKRSIKNSLSNVWKNYDYNFNFYSDKRLVCSALVLKSYAKESYKDEWIDIELEKIGISLTYPPNNFIKKVIEEWFKNKSEIEWVFFIDSLEKTWENFVSTVPELFESWKRSRFSMFLK